LNFAWPNALHSRQHGVVVLLSVVLLSVVLRLHGDGRRRSW